MAKTAVDWFAINREILEGLDIEAEHRALGLKIKEGAVPNAGSWLAAHAIDREDKRPSVYINVGHGPARGRYKDSAAHGEPSLSYFDFALAHGPVSGFVEVQKKYAYKAGAKLPGGKRPERPEDKLEFGPLFPSVARAWAAFKGGIDEFAIFKAGARAAQWPKGAPSGYIQSVIAFPSYGEHLTDAGPVGWVIYESSNEDLLLYQGKGVPPEKHRLLTVAGSKPGLLNPFALERIKDAKIIWKVEGPSDMLALQSAIPIHRQYKHVVIAHTFGAQESIQPSWIKSVRTK
jgi:hypothetical protein